MTSLSIRASTLLATLAAAIVAGCTPAALEAGPAAPEVAYLTQQETLAPLPVQVRLPASQGAEHVLVLFHTFGSRGWQSKELGRAGQTWAGEISCREVSTVTGDTQYFFVVLDAEGEVLGGIGSPETPHVATVVGSLPGGPQSLPGRHPPLRCHDPADCPPDFPGCPAYATLRHSCRSDADCGDDGRCAWDRYCGSPHAEAPPGASPEAEEDLEVALKAITSRYRKTASAAPRKPAR